MISTVSTVAAVAAELAMLPQTDLGIKHHFSDGVYAKQMHLPKGHQAVSHRHAYSHLSVLATGVAIVKTDDTETTYTAPACIEIAAGVKHAITALEDVTWFCIHATHETDVENIDRVLIREN